MMRVLLLTIAALLTGCANSTDPTLTDSPPAKSWEATSEGDRSPGVPVLDLSLPTLTLTTPLQFVVTGDNLPGEQVRLVMGSNGTGAGPCPPPAGGLCLDVATPAELFGSAVTDASGTATIDVSLPATFIAGTNLTFQAMVVRGVGGVDSFSSPTVEAATVDPEAGCTDPTAANFDPGANLDDGSCVGIGAPDRVASLEATPIAGDVDLAWSTPDGPDGVVVVRQMAAVVDGKPTDGVTHVVGDPIGSAGEVVYVGSDSAFTDVDPGPGIATYAVWAYNDAASPVYGLAARDQALLPHSVQTGTIQVDLTTGQVNTTDFPSDIHLAGNASYDAVAQTLSVNVNITSFVQRYLFNAKLLVTSVGEGSTSSTVGPMAGEYIGAVLPPAIVTTTTLEFAGVTGAVDPYPIGLRVMDHPLALGSAGWDDGVTGIDTGGSGIDNVVRSAPVSYRGESGDSMFYQGVISPDGRFAYLGNRNKAVITTIDLATMTATNGVELSDRSGPLGPIGFTDGLRLSEDGETLWAVLTEGQHGWSGGSIGPDSVQDRGTIPKVSLLRFQRRTMLLTGRVEIAQFVDRSASARDLAINEAAGLAAIPVQWVGAVFLVDLDTMTVIDTQPAPGIQGVDVTSLSAQPTKAAISPDGSTVWVALKETGMFATIDTSTFALSSFTPASIIPFYTGRMMFGDDGRLYYGDKGEGLMILDPDSLTESQLIPIGASVYGWDFNGDQTVVYANDNDALVGYHVPTLTQLDLDGDLLDGIVGDAPSSWLDFGETVIATPF